MIKLTASPSASCHLLPLGLISKHSTGDVDGLLLGNTVGTEEGKSEGFLLGNSVGDSGGANVGDIVSDPPPHAQHACEAVSP